jgi:hypothetical protein
MPAAVKYRIATASNPLTIQRKWRLMANLLRGPNRSLPLLTTTASSLPCPLWCPPGGAGALGEAEADGRVIRLVFARPVETSCKHPSETR